MSTPTILIAGCGDVGCRLANQLLQAGHRVYGLRRTINQLPCGIQGIAADLGKPSTLSDLPPCDIVVYAVAASRHDEAGYQAAYYDGLHNLMSALKQPPRHLFFTSSTSVYHQSQDEWVDETSPTEPTGFSGRIMLAAEQLALSHDFPASVVRFSGIYGPGRNHLLNQVRQGIGADPATPAYSNRIHSEDCAGVLAHLIGRALAGRSLERCYLASDDQPTPLHEVSGWLAAQLGVSLESFGTRRRAGSKRCSNRRLRATGYHFRYPDYRAGYGEILRQLPQD